MQSYDIKDYGPSPISKILPYFLGRNACYIGLFPVRNEIMVKKDSFIRRAKLIRIKDGDTQVFLIDVGYHCRSEVSIRLQGVDTPETFRPKDKDERRRGMAAKKFVRKWFKDHKHGEKKWPLWIKTQMTKKEEPTIRMTLTRYVGSIYCTQGHSLAEAIVEAGHIK